MIHHHSDLSHDFCNVANSQNQDFIDSSKPVWYLERIDSKSSWIVSSAL